MYEIVRGWGVTAVLPITPHDLRGTFTRLAYRASAPVEQIQYSLGHASLLTTERYLGLRQNLAVAPGDLMRLGFPDPGLSLDSRQV